MRRYRYRIILLCLLVINPLKGEEVKPDSRISRVCNSVKETFKKADAALNYILSVKGAVKTLVFVSPLIMVYYKIKKANFDSYNPLEELAAKVIRKIHSAKTFYEINKQMGQTDALLDTIEKHPWSSIYFMFGNIGKGLLKKINAI